jgi:hypothetical protein
MSDNIHWVIPGAVLAPDGDGGVPASPPPGTTPHLDALLRLLAPAGRIDAAEGSPAMPYELLLARLNGLPGEPGRVPWAAFEHGLVGTPCAALHLCHWQVGTDHILLGAPDALHVEAGESAELLAAMAPYFAEDGIGLALTPSLPGTWLATGEPLRRLRTVSLDRVVGRRLTREFFEADGPEATVVRRLQNEMQMLLYTHPLNAAREQRGLRPVNSFWLTGAGVLDAPLAPAPDVRVEPRLHAAARELDPAAHAAAWQAVDADLCQRLADDARAGQPVQLSLCGARAAQTFTLAPSGLWPRLQRALRPAPSPDTWLKSL